MLDLRPLAVRFPLIFVIFLGVWSFQPDTSSEEACECGRAISSRIYNGVEVSARDFPWMALLLTGNATRYRECGASVISSRYAVTAGHCVKREPSKNPNIYLVPEFDASINSREIFRKEPNVEKVIMWGHADGKDIAVLKTKRNMNVPPLCLPPLHNSFVGAKATMLGSGLTGDKLTPENTLKSGNVTILSNARVSGRYVFDSDIYADTFKGAAMHCKGDSGAPLMYFNTTSKRWIFIGIVSRGSEICKAPNGLQIFTRVSSFLHWIQKVTDHAGCQPEGY